MLDPRDARHAETLVQTYYAEAAAQGLPPHEVEPLERLVHEDRGPRVVAYIAEAAEEPATVAPGAGLAALTKAERERLLRLTRAYYADPERAPLDALVALYDKTRASAREVAKDRKRQGWTAIPTWTEWATARNADGRVIVYGRARIRGGSLEACAAAFTAGLRVEDRSFTIWRPEPLARVLALYEQLRTDAAREQKRRTAGKVELADRTVFPAQLIRSGFMPDTFTRLVERLTGQPDLFNPIENALEVIRAQAKIDYNPAQLGDLTASEVRGMHAVFRLFTREGDDHQKFTTDSVSVPAATLYLAAGIASRKTEDRVALFNGLRALSHRNLAVALTTKDTDGKWCVIGDHTRVFEMRPVWKSSEDKRRKRGTEADPYKISEQYVQHIADGKPWTGRLPDLFVFTLPKLMRRISERLVLRGDVLTRLEAGSQSVRGAQAGLNPLDHLLLVTITQHQQAQHKSTDGLRYRSYVNREELLALHYGAENLARWKRTGNFRDHAQVPYEKAARALLEGGLVAHWEPQRRTTRGALRDVFELAPDVVVGTEHRLGDPAQEPLFTPPKRRRRSNKKEGA